MSIDLGAVAERQKLLNWKHEDVFFKNIDD